MADRFHELRDLVQLGVGGDSAVFFPAEEDAGNERVDGLGDEDGDDADEAGPAD